MSSFIFWKQNYSDLSSSGWWAVAPSGARYHIAVYEYNQLRGRCEPYYCAYTHADGAHVARDGNYKGKEYTTLKAAQDACQQHYQRGR